VNNTIVASIVFSFQGETHGPGITLDLDAIMHTHGYIPDLHGSIATANNIDTYSYLFEVMESQEIEFTQPTGLAEHCCVEGVFDAEEFARLWHRQQALSVLGPIAKRHLDIDALEQHPALQAALIAAFDAGKAGSS